MSPPTASEGILGTINTVLPNKKLGNWPYPRAALLEYVIHLYLTPRGL